jgi:hypothetical protein
MKILSWLIQNFIAFSYITVLFVFSILLCEIADFYLELRNPWILQVCMGALVMQIYLKTIKYLLP